MLRRIQDLLNTDHHEVIIRPFMQNHSSTMQLTSPISSENLMQSRLGEHGLQSIDVGGAGDCFLRLARFTLEDHAYGASRLPKTTVLQSTLDLYHINKFYYLGIATIICVYVLLGFNL